MLLVVLALAVRQDLLQRRISNFLTIGTLAAGIGIHWLAHGVDGALHALAGASVGLLCLLPLYLLKGMGAGDVKLLMAAGAFLGPANAFVAALVTLVAGAVIALLVIIRRFAGSSGSLAMSGNGSAGDSRLQTPVAAAAAEKFPYAAAIAAGVVATMWLRGLFQPLAGALS
jgi:prepilin peptidase CpaA